MVLPDADSLDLDAVWCVWDDARGAAEELADVPDALGLMWGCWRARAFVVPPSGDAQEVGVLAADLSPNDTSRRNGIAGDRSASATLSDPAIDVAAGVLSPLLAPAELLRRPMAHVDTSLAMLEPARLDSWLRCTTLLDASFYRNVCRASAPWLRPNGGELLLEYLKVAVEVACAAPTLFLRHDGAALIFFVPDGDPIGVADALRTWAASESVDHVEALIHRGLYVPLAAMG